MNWDQFQQFIYYRTYSRWRDDLGRRENWEETVDRLIEFFTEDLPKVSPNKFELSAVTKNAIERAIKNREVMPSMRALWAAGEAARASHVTLYNCSFAAVDSIEAFSEILYVLMCGTGNGFSVEQVFIELLPSIEFLPAVKEPTGKVVKIKVADSKYGWATALDKAIRALYKGHSIEVDYSQIRPRGARLLTMGGRASGPEPLMRLMDYIQKVFKKRSGQRLRDIEVHDIVCMTAEIVVVGGVRRSSLISLSDLGSSEMARAKFGDFWKTDNHRSMANNSAVYNSKPSMVTFMREWLNLVVSNSGERGIFNREGARRLMTANGRRKEHKVIGTNPCQPEFATILTPEGIRTFKDIDVGSTVWSGKQWTKVVAKWSTGVKSVYEYSTRAGRFVGTENHKVFQNGERVEAASAEAIDTAVCDKSAITNVGDAQDTLDGLVFGDGYRHKASNNLPLLCIGDKDQDYFESEVAHLIGRHRPGISEKSYEISTTLSGTLAKRTYERVIPDRFYHGNTQKVQSFLRGLFSANGSMAGDRVTLKATSLTVIKQVQEMLSFLGIRSYYTVNKPSTIKWSNGTYTSKESYDLNITGDRDKFEYLIGFIQKYKTERLREVLGKTRKFKAPKTTYEVMDVSYLGEHEVFDITVEAEEHSYWTGGLRVSNCAEIILRSKQFCNLSSVVIRPEDTLQTLREKVRLATIIGTIQSSFTDFPFLRPEWKKNCEEERLLGVSLNGMMDHPVLSTISDEAKLWLSDLKHTAIETNKNWARKLGINVSAAITCVKPEGTGSKMLGTASGIHPRYAKFQKRRVRISATDPLFNMLRDQGVPASPENGQEPATADTWVLTFPLSAPEGAKTRHDITAIEQLEHWKMVREFWAEHSVSMTCYVAEHEWMEVGAWVYRNFDHITGLSFLPKGDDHAYAQAPEEEITKGEFEQFAAGFPQIDFGQLSKYEFEDMTEGSKSYSCTGGQCEIL